MPESLEEAVENYLMLLSIGATPSELTEPLREMKNALEERQCTMDVEQCFLSDMYLAVEESDWIPPQYMMNDWASDVCQFLRTGNGVHDNVQ